MSQASGRAGASVVTVCLLTKGLVNERVDIYNIDTGARLSTYVIEAPPGSGTIGLNGAAARLAMMGDKVIIVAYANFDEAEARTFQPRVVLVNERNQKL